VTDSQGRSVLLVSFNSDMVRDCGVG
jgi:hypothetical protein